MTVETGGPVRGFIARWLMRFDASRSLLSPIFNATTAVSALSGVLAYAGFRALVLPVVGLWLALIPVIAWAYVDLGVWNRANREKADHSENYAGPTLRIDDEHIARGVIAGLRGRQLEGREREAIKRELDMTYQEYRDGYRGVQDGD